MPESHQGNPVLRGGAAADATDAGREQAAVLPSLEAYPRAAGAGGLRCGGQ